MSSAPDTTTAHQEDESDCSYTHFREQLGGRTTGSQETEVWSTEASAGGPDACTLDAAVTECIVENDKTAAAQAAILEDAKKSSSE